MVFSIIGLGNSSLAYENKGEGTIGVNDSFKIFPVDYLVVVDPQSVFTKERLKIIKESTPIEFLSHYDEWSYMPGFKKIRLAPERFNLDYIDSDMYCYADNSPFVAVHHAYKLGASEIVLYGVDFVNHPKLNDEDHIRRILKMYHEFKKELNKRGVAIYVSGAESLLSRVLPIYA